jgi:hypothetical protein
VLCEAAVVRDALADARCYRGREACVLVKQCMAWAAQLVWWAAASSSSPTSSTHSAARHGLHGHGHWGAARASAGLCWGAADWLAPNMHSFAAQGSRRHPGPSSAIPVRTARRFGSSDGAVGSNSGHHPAKDLNLLSRFHALGILHARFEKPSLHSESLPSPAACPHHTTAASCLASCLLAQASACSLCRLHPPRQRLRCLAPLTPFALPSLTCSRPCGPPYL